MVLLKNYNDHESVISNLKPKNIFFEKLHFLNSNYSLTSLNCFLQIILF